MPRPKREGPPPKRGGFPTRDDVLRPLRERAGDLADLPILAQKRAESPATAEARRLVLALEAAPEGTAAELGRLLALTEPAAFDALAEAGKSARARLAAYRAWAASRP